MKNIIKLYVISVMIMVIIFYYFIIKLAVSVIDNPSIIWEKAWAIVNGYSNITNK